MFEEEEEELRRLLNNLNESILDDICEIFKEIHKNRHSLISNKKHIMVVATYYGANKRIDIGLDELHELFDVPKRKIRAVLKTFRNKVFEDDKNWRLKSLFFM